MSSNCLNTQNNYYYFFEWEDTIKSITQVYLQQIRKKIQIITKNKQNSHMHTIISEKKKKKLYTINYNF